MTLLPVPAHGSPGTAEDLVDRAPCGFLVTGPDGVVVRVNDAFLQATGLRTEDVLGRPVGALLAPGGRIYLDTFVLPALLVGGHVEDVALDVLRADGTRLPVLVNANLGRDEAGRPAVIRLVTFDASQRLAFERDLVQARRAAEEAGRRMQVLHRAAAALGRGATPAEIRASLLAVLAEQFPHARVDVWVGAPDGYPAAGAPPTVAQAVRDRQVTVAVAGAPDTGTLLAAPLVGKGRVLGCYSLELPAGDVLATEDLALHQTLGEQAGAALDRASLHEELDRRASHDPLTGVLNRASLVEGLQEVLDEARRDAAPVGVLFVDLDGFKSVNDQLGHRAGDELLIEVTRRLRQVLRGRDLLGRLGGDEFVVVCRDSSERTALRIADRLQAALAAPTGACTAHVGASVGVVVHDPRRTPGQVNAEDVLQDADAAMYQAKAAGRGRHVLYDADLRGRLTRRTAVERRLRAALAGDGVVLDYQPVFDLAAGTVSGVEALCRIETEGHRLMPDEFIGIAEETGLLVALGERVLTTACTQMAAWTAAGVAPVTVAVNVAAVQAARPTFADEVLDVLERTGVAPERLLLELTESTLLAATAATLAGLRRLRDHGIGIALDDFGTSYASLRYVQQFPLTWLKIDRSFVAPLPDGRAERAIVRAVVGLASELGMQCTAEGIETSEQRHFLTELGVHGQGFALARPMPAREVRALLDRRGDS